MRPKRKGRATAGRTQRREDGGAEPPELAALRAAAEGLAYPSESDAPFDAFAWPGDGDPAALAAANTGNGPDEVEEVPAADFFAELEGTSDAERFIELRRALESTLAGLRVLRVGSRKVDVFIVGKTPGGAWAGLHTTSVET